MTDEAAAPASKASTPIADDVLNAAAETRSTAKWVASALGAIPGLSILAAIVTAPGEGETWNVLLLVPGLFFLGAGALWALTDFAKVLQPIALSDVDVRYLTDLSIVPGAPAVATTGKLPGADLLDQISSARTALAKERHAAVQAGIAMKKAQAAAAEREATALRLEHMAKSPSADRETKDRAAEARAEAGAAQASAASAAGEYGAAEYSAQVPETQLRRLDRVRTSALLVLSARRVGSRFETAMSHLPFALFLVGTGVVLVALAPQGISKAGSAPELTTLTLSDKAQQLIGCDVDAIQAIRVGGSDERPVFITLPTVGCTEARTIEVPYSGRTGEYGSYVKVSPVPLPTPTPSPS
jgi:hypothetical protein